MKPKTLAIVKAFAREICVKWNQTAEQHATVINSKLNELMAQMADLQAKWSIALRTMEMEAAHSAYLLVTLEPSELDSLFLTRREDAHKGGFQSLIVELQSRLAGDNETEIALRLNDVLRISSYAGYNNGSGGFQGRLRKIFGRTLGEYIRPIAPGKPKTKNNKRKELK